ncbi:hypothetical protein ACVIYL_002317 [Bradyrhizobium sp. USDA 3315]
MRSKSGFPVIAGSLQLDPVDRAGAGDLQREEEVQRDRKAGDDGGVVVHVRHFLFPMAPMS